MIKIAVASDQGRVTEHFGHCESFVVFEAEGTDILSETVLPNPGHRPGFLPNYLHEQGVQVIISGGMGGGAIDIFNQHDIEVIVGASGLAKRSVAAYVRGELKSTGSVCHQHAHHGDC
ncbi:MAG: dinitrogenase iron-molybdenum cofactor [Firmicutes bacterium GWF2_51_9]|nr:NifB/NifX family molybdenum-iron cluster-binding protein [Erysipelotrichaceae bacterium]OGS54577.1 MAG: dinitrogenase iron-molybdenum cofactor [Firmicutes bacterium GWF2_51_9]OGS59521.1 MAG: dinitrogenase iron-molybdenum cofactor [Firmicutes bacterium GWE2_51_13]HAM63077.1 dinitrogenase iron-molybdenum cofactor [Erysipelotrichaceae bacterium]HAO61086.1 dinitrogenase iron-molybdenum cofactor [Erysipelotrichaceae bacterium]